MRKEQLGGKQRQRMREDGPEEPQSDEDIGAELFKRPAAARAKSRAKAKAKAKGKANAKALAKSRVKPQNNPKAQSRKSPVKPPKKPQGNRQTLDVELVQSQPQEEAGTKGKRKVGDKLEIEGPAEEWGGGSHVCKAGPTNQ